MEKQITCIYHKDCVDGTSAAAVVLKKYPNAQTFPLAHNYAPEEIATILDCTQPTAHIYIVDTTVGLTDFLMRGYEVTVIDHHISEHTHMLEVARTHPNLEYVFDNTKSGASLAWSYFFKDVLTPSLIQFVEDNDLWKKALGENTEHVVNFLSLSNNNPMSVLTLFDEEIDSVIEQGRILTTYTHEKVGRLVLLEPVLLTIGNSEVQAYNITDYQSACGNALAKENDAAVALYTIIGTSVKISFRSLDHHNPSALKCAMVLGGGGHRNAAGATLSFTDFINRIVI